MDKLISDVSRKLLVIQGKSVILHGPYKYKDTDKIVCGHKYKIIDRILKNTYTIEEIIDFAIKMNCKAISRTRPRLNKKIGGQWYLKCQDRNFSELKLEIDTQKPDTYSKTIELYLLEFANMCESPEIIPRRYKKKEMEVVDYLRLKLPEYNFIHNQSVGSAYTCENENSNGHLFPDIRYDCGRYHLIVEVDEHKHRNYKCDERRMYDIIAKLGLPCIFIRYNPDSPESNKETLLECIKKYLDIDENQVWNDFALKVEYLFY